MWQWECMTKKFSLRSRQEIEQEEVRNKIPEGSVSGDLLLLIGSYLLKFPKPLQKEPSTEGLDLAKSLSKRDNASLKDHKRAQN